MHYFQSKAKRILLGDEHLIFEIGMNVIPMCTRRFASGGKHLLESFAKVHLVRLGSRPGGLVWVDLIRRSDVFFG